MTLSPTIKVPIHNNSSGSRSKGHLNTMEVVKDMETSQSNLAINLKPRMKY